MPQGIIGSESIMEIEIVEQVEIVEQETRPDANEVARIRAEKNWAELQKEEYRGSLNFPLLLYTSASRGPYVTILVGPKPQTTYLLPVLILCHRVKYFENVFMGNFQEARDGILELPDMNVGTFEMFMYWVLTDQFRLPLSQSDPIENRTSEIALLIDLVRWADRWLLTADHELMLKAMSKLKDKLNIGLNCLTPQTIDVAFSSGSEELKKVLAQYCVIPYVRWMRDFETPFPFEVNVSHTPDFMRHISAALVDCLRCRQVFGTNGREIAGKVRLTGVGVGIDWEGSNIDF